MDKCDIAVIGGGPAGCMAAIRSGELGRKVALIERNESIGKKVLITGKGRCNLTNTASIDIFIKKFSPGGEFFRTAFFAFSNEDLMAFFRSNGLELKVERQGRVFPSDDRARSVVVVLEKCLKDSKVDTRFNKRVTAIDHKGAYFIIYVDGKAFLEAAKVIITTGGASYRVTGSTGDGFNISERMGHTVVKIKPALVPLTTSQRWVKDLQGLGLENVRVIFQYGRKKFTSEVGEVMFTHFGVSGPLILDNSADVVSMLEKCTEVPIYIDLKPALTDEQIEKRLVKLFAAKGNMQINSIMQELLPKKMVAVFLDVLNIRAEKQASQITKDERRVIVDTLKNFPLTINGSLPIEEAMVTGGGVSKKDINPRTMESKIVPGLYFAGEVIEGAAPSGGYNLQQAFSTGYLAGEKAASL